MNATALGTVDPAVTPPPYEVTFRKEVAKLVRDVLVAFYETRRLEARKEAYRRQVSVEHLAAEQVARLVMDKVDAEYL